MIKLVTKEFGDVFEKSTIFRSAVFKACQSIAGHRYDLVDNDYKDLKTAYTVLKEAMDVLDRKVGQSKG